MLTGVTVALMRRRSIWLVVVCVQGSGKGAVSVRMDIYGVSVCIVNVHFRAHRHNYAGRVMVSSILLSFPSQNLIF